LSKGFILSLSKGFILSLSKGFVLSLSKGFVLSLSKDVLFPVPEAQTAYPKMRIFEWIGSIRENNFLLIREDDFKDRPQIVLPF
jgi:hypothetical protein